AEELIYALQDDAGQVLNLNRGRAFDPQHQYSRFRGVIVLRLARPLDLLRLGMRRDRLADDLRPARHQLDRCESLLGKDVIQRLAQDVGERTRRSAARLVHVRRLCHRSIMRLAGDRLARKASTPSAPSRDDLPRAGDLLSWYDRHRRALPWRAPPGQRSD